jgi:hypothetical protein
MSLSGGEKLQAKLEEIAAKIGRPFMLRVGFLEGATYPDGTPVGYVAALLNYGISNGKVWPFFTKMIAEKAPSWGEQLANLLIHTNYDVDKALGLMGTGIAGQLREAIIDMKTPPIDPRTAARKGFDRPLIDTGHMLNSIDYEVAES